MRSAILLVLLTTAAHAGNNELTITESTRALRTSSANAITADGLFGGALGYGRRLLVLPDLELWGQGTFGWGVADGMMFQTLTTELDTLTLMAGGQLRYALHHRITASARLDVGTTRAALAIRDEAGHSASDHGWGAISSAGLGIDCYVFHGERYAMALRFELAAVATSSIPLAGTPDSMSEGTLQLEMTAASLGSLNLSGPSFAASIVGQF
ncbi:MAG TPA: hypothetical protein VIV40_04890 [Kofleriaceae bacterium]